jgi:hypothetical protein
MKDDDFCNKYDCTVSTEYQDECFTYFKGDYDVDCHLNCELGNCTRVATTDVMCIVYSCWLSSTSTSTTPGPITTTPIPSSDDHVNFLIGGSLGIVIILALIFIGFFLWFKNRRLGHEILVEDENPNNVIQSENVAGHFSISTPSSSSEHNENEDNVDNNTAHDLDSVFSGPEYHQPDRSELEQRLHILGNALVGQNTQPAETICLSTFTTSGPQPEMDKVLVSSC